MVKRQKNKVRSCYNLKSGSIMIASVVCIILTGCASDPNKVYPVSYTFDHLDQNDEALYLVGIANDLSTLPSTIGSYGAAKEEFKGEIRDGISTIFDLKEIILLNEDSARIHWFSDDIEYDTIVSYTSVANEINIDALNGGLITYDKTDDQFILCGVTTFALAGPNVANPGQEYNQYTLIECTPGFQNKDYATKKLSEFDYQPQDTLGVLLTKLFYK